MAVMPRLIAFALVVSAAVVAARPLGEVGKQLEGAAAAGARALLGAADHTYKVHDAVPPYANKVGPFHNPR